jgi:anti-anti-sigma factor
VFAGCGVPDLSIHDHLCFVYGDHTEAQQALLEYVVAGLARRERVCVLADTADATIDADLRSVGVPVDALADAGVLIFGSAEEAYLAGGSFDADRTLERYAEAARAAVAEGFTGLRAYAESQFLLGRPDSLAAWPAYELRADLLATQLPITAVCAYDSRRWPADDLMMAETVHTRRSRNQTAFGLHAGRDGALRLSGEIDFCAARQLHRLLVSTAPTRTRPVLDVSGVTFIDVSGARSLGTACEDVAGRLGPTTVRGATPLLRQIWDLTSWSDSFPNVIIEA